MKGAPTPGADVVVVGAGLAGLSAARVLAREGLRPLVLEREEEPGGRVRSTHWEGCTIELGAFFLTSRYRRLRSLIADCALTERLSPVPAAFRVAVWRDGRCHHLDYRWPELQLARYSGLRWSEKLALARMLPRRILAEPRMRFFDMASVAGADAGSLERTIGLVRSKGSACRWLRRPRPTDRGC